MARDIITVFEPEREATNSLAGVVVTPKAVTVANGITIADALENKDNSLQITITASADSKAIFKASDTYPNAIRGDQEYTIKAGINTIILVDISRFENKDKSVNIDFQTGFSGSIYAVAKHSGIRKVSE